MYFGARMKYQERDVAALVQSRQSRIRFRRET